MSFRFEDWPVTSKLVNPAVLLVVATFLSACSDEIDGTYEPACIAYAGDRVVLAEGRFEWHKFTDEVRLDKAGERIDPFPGYPKSGSFEMGRYDQLVFSADDGSELGDRYPMEYRDHIYLLSYDDNEAVLDGEDMPNCALRLVEPDDA